MEYPRNILKWTLKLVCLIWIYGHLIDGAAKIESKNKFTF